jgi:hypothetical protein
MPRFHLTADVAVDRPLEEVRAFLSDVKLGSLGSLGEQGGARNAGPDHEHGEVAKR